MAYKPRPRRLRGHSSSTRRWNLSQNGALESYGKCFLDRLSKSIITLLFVIPVHRHTAPLSTVDGDDSSTITLTSSYRQCTSAHRHQYTLPQDTPTPRFLAKLLTKAMPRYKGGMTRAIMITYALLYLHRIKTCFHCTRSAEQRPTDGDGKPSSPQMDITSQCSLFFSVGMHYASLWLLDCCPAEHMYWSVLPFLPYHGSVLTSK